MCANKMTTALVAVIFCLLVVNVNCKSIEHGHQSCSQIKHFFDTIGVTSGGTSLEADQFGQICNGNCCDTRTEEQLIQKSTESFQRIVKDHTQSHRSLWESTANTFRDHVFELLRQSENRTLSLFNTVYTRMTHMSRQPIQELYKSIQSHFLSKISSNANDESLERSVNNFFVQLFPVAYLHGINSERFSGDSSSSKKLLDFNADYKNCLSNMYEQFQPFGKVTKELSQSITQSVHLASVFLRGLQGGAKVLGGVESLDVHNLDVNCKEALLKMNYCSSCKGYSHVHVKPCYGYCMNVMRGCLNLYLGTLNKDWNSFTDAIPKLNNLVTSQDMGIENVIRSLDSKLSNAIMYAMEHGPQIDKNIKHACGNPSLIEKQADVSHRPQNPRMNNQNNPWPSPIHTILIDFMSSIDRAKDFFMRISDSLCEDYRTSQPKKCWDGSHLGEYSHDIIGYDQQKYNPAVKISQDPSGNEKLHILNDQLVNLRNVVLKPLSTHSHMKYDNDKMLSDMALEEGSGGYADDNMNDDEDYVEGSGEGGSGDGGIEPRTPIVGVPSNPSDNDAGGAATTRQLSLTSLYASLLMFVIVLRLH
ncbi:division abnormally delayed protein [Culicoides brevitarsis]|uniref:division abnormally delayed protein n=1 Tax=Culicoides brevitarsis TaxID=469753 RepID=UPI00307CAB8F